MRRLWIVWLMLALLPLRGWAFMALATPTDGHLHTLQAAAPIGDAAAPCHGDGAHGADDAPDDAHAGCSLCEVCHGAAAPPVADAAAALLPAGPATPHAAAPPRGDADPQGPFKPPRD